MTYPTLPAETTYSDIERDLIDNEPPGMFPEDQNSYWGQMRKIHADYLQANALDLFTAWYNNLDPRSVDANDITEWEYRVGVPGDRSSLSLTARRSFVQSRLVAGAFSRSLVSKVIENFINAVLVVGTASTSFGMDGVSLGAGGATLYSGVSGDPKTMYRVYFDYMNRTYYVRVVNTLGEDLSGLTRELQRITPGGWTLNISDVANILSYTKMILDAAPVGYYKLDTTAADASGYANAGTLQNAPGSVTSLITVAADGGAGTALSFNGTTQYILVPDVSSGWPFSKMSLFTASVDAWVKLAGTPAAGAFGTIWSKGGYLFGVDENRKLVLVPPVGTTLRSPAALSLTTTYHVAVTIKDTVVTLYVNGVAVATGTAAPGVSMATITNIGRSQAGSNYYLNGTLDELGIYDSVLSPAQVLSHYNTGNNTP